MTRASRTFTISFPRELADEVERRAMAEHRTRSELFREAFRRYVMSEQRWERILDYGARAARARGLNSEAEVDAAVDVAVEEVRRARRHG
jgi:metal-responsive CopG/Arc/MetJ family transcriptional regulator